MTSDRVSPDQLRALADRLNSPGRLQRADNPRHFQDPPFLRLIDDLLLDLAAGVHHRQLLFAPPRHGKSVRCSHYFPAWFLLTYPDRRVLLASYEADFAAQWGRKVRDTVTKWGPVFGVKVRPDSKAADRWEIEQYGGGMQTAGAGGPLLGKGFDLGIIDDPVKNATEALSPTYRQKVWDWYGSTFETRMEPGARVVVTQQRWHTEDLGGRLLKEQPRDWRCVSIAALAEPGDVLGRAVGAALWPERYPKEELERKRRNAPTWFAAQYQQHPLDLEGGFFRGLDRIKVLAATPTADNFLRQVRFWDLASTEAQAGADPDWTVGVRMARHKDGGYVVLHLVRERLGPQGVRRLIRQTAELDGKPVPVRIEREGGASGKIAADLLVREVLDGWPALAGAPEGSKAERAEPWGSQIEAGNVTLVRGEWNAALLDEHRAFPSGDHDDQVDACSGAHNYLAGKREVNIR